MGTQKSTPKRTDFLLASLVKDLRRLIREPASLLLWLGIPLAIGGLMSLAVGGGGGGMPAAKVLVEDRDDSFASGVLVKLLGGMGEGVQAEKLPIGAGVSEFGVVGSPDSAASLTPEISKRLEREKISAVLVIPEGFGDALMGEEPRELLLFTNPSQRILPGIFEEGLSIAVDLVFYARKLLDQGSGLDESEASVLDRLLAMGQGEPSRAEVLAVSSALFDRMDELGARLFPPMLKLVTPSEESSDESAAEQKSQRRPSHIELLLPGILMMALVFTAQGLSEDIWFEGRSGNLKRAKQAPDGLIGLAAGKLLSGTLVMAAISLVGLSLCCLVIPSLRAVLLTSVVWSSACGAALLALMFLAQLAVSNQRTAAVLVGFLVFPCLMLGGSFFPLESLPDWMGRMGRWTPNGWALTGLKDILRGEGMPWATFAALLAVCGGLLWLVVLRLKKRAVEL